MKAPYFDPFHALRRAYTKPRPFYGAVLGERRGKDFDSLDRAEQIAQDAMVRNLAEHHCSELSKYAFEIVWCDDPDRVETAIRAHHLHLCANVSGRKPPLRFFAEAAYRWRRGARRVRGLRSDVDWARELNADRRTVAGWRRGAAVQLNESFRSGVAAASPVLRERGLVFEQQ